MLFHRRPAELPTPQEALSGRDTPIAIPARHTVLDAPLRLSPAEGQELAIFGMGCFWGAERLLWQQGGVITTAAGYAGGLTPNPTYEEVCSGLTGHAEVVGVVFDTQRLSYPQLLALFWEAHDPTQGMRQGNDSGTQYRSIILTTSPGQAQVAQASKASFQERLRTAGYGAITTTIAPAGRFYYAEAYHQQYLAKNPNGYCGLAGTGVSCPVGLGVAGEAPAAS